ncbi:ABC transporter substrate-binding protein [Marinimicrobium sp. ABcell2]|uniref:substrate-binding periplasmic protein n=1 Tax=Marinimicrobium sp. ABcell2 TaxID=3069751 RepID=UPI0027B184A1|nr:transporter substrate-binding domain-containing protein [Marinimicrobium sp. ABcell2]MDQ2076864.1 transporter substrate-binding domain-containing protein [Marinimicrobium sp. ABcell2]
MADTLVVRYPVLTNDNGQQYNHDYYLELLTLALDKAGLDYRFETVILPEFREIRSELSLAKGIYDIHWLHTNRQRETRLRPIRIPLFKGMIGWRVFLINEKDQERFAGISSVEELKELRTVQGHDWPDTPILQRNGFSVIRSASWEGMFRMLSSGRVDYFPRSAMEVQNELVQFSNQGLVLEQTLALHYPTAYYFFVARENDKLAEAVEKGLNIAIADGSFDTIFMAHFGADIERTNLSSRTVLRLENPLLTEQTPLERAELWFEPLLPPKDPNPARD